MADNSPFILQSNLMLPTTDWHIKCLPGEVVRIFNIQHEDSTSQIPVSVSRLLIVREDYTWICKVNGLEVPKTCSIFSSLPKTLTLNDFTSLLTSLKSSSVCPGNPDSCFIELCNSRKGQFLSVKRTAVASLDKSNPSSLTIQHTSCHLLVPNGKRCCTCRNYRNCLRSMLSSFRKSNKMLSKTNYRYLNRPQRILQKKSLKKSEEPCY